MTHDRFRLSVIVPTHNTRELTLQCLGAAIADADASIELLLVDDGSSDGTAEAAAAAFPSVRIVRRPYQGGFTAAANDGLTGAQGDVLFLLNSDAVVEPGSLSRLIAAFDARPGLGIAGACLFGEDGRTQWSGGPTPTPFWLFLNASGVPALLGRIRGYRRLWPGGGRRGRVDWVSGAAMAVRRETWQRLGALDDSFMFYGQDLEVCLRARDLGFEVALLSEVRVRHLGGGTMRRRPGATGSGVHPGFLWTDLLRVVQKRAGVRAARRAARFLMIGIGVRSLLRKVATPFVVSAERAAWDRDSDAYANGRAMVSAWASALEKPAPTAPSSPR